MAFRALLENFSSFLFGQRQLEVFAENSEFTQIHLVHYFLQMVELPILGNVLPTVEVEDLL